MIYGKINEIMNDLSKIENNTKWGWNSYIKTIWKSIWWENIKCNERMEIEMF